MKTAHRDDEHQGTKVRDADANALYGIGKPLTLPSAELPDPPSAPALQGSTWPTILRAPWRARQKRAPGDRGAWPHKRCMPVRGWPESPTAVRQSIRTPAV